MVRRRATTWWLLGAFLVAALGARDVFAAESRQYKLGGGPSGGIFGIISGPMADIIQRAVPGLTVTAVASQGSAENTIRTSRGEFQFALAGNDGAYQGYHGAKGFPGKMQDFRMVVSGNRSYVHMMVPADSPAKDWRDLKGKRIAVTSPTSPNFISTSAVMEQHGIKTSDYEPRWITSSQYVDAMRNGTIDAAHLIAGYPAPAPQELCTAKVGLRLLPVPADIASGVARTHPFLEPGTIAAGVYSCVKGEVPTIFSTVWLIAHKDTPADIVYAVVARILEKQELAEVHATGKEWRLDKALSGLAGLPLHPGAERYYREKGLLK